VSIIIPNWNGGETLSHCLESILEHTRRVEFELIVIDNGSSDDSRRTVEDVAARDHRVTAVLNDENLFFARACNQGFRLSRGEFILIANNDILLADDAVSRLVDHADRFPEVSVVTPRFLGPEGKPQEFYRRLPMVYHVLAHYHPIGRALDRFLLGRRIQNHYFYRDLAFDDVEIVEQAGASFSLFRRDTIESLGMLFDERFPLLFNDVDLAYRIHETRRTGHVVPSIEVIHLAGVSTAKLDPAVLRGLRFGAIFEYFKLHHPGQYPLLCLAWPRWWIFRR
jgi:GT2 family glycosyltransferase